MGMRAQWTSRDKFKADRDAFYDPWWHPFNLVPLASHLYIGTFAVMGFIIVAALTLAVAFLAVGVVLVIIHAITGWPSGF